MKIKIKQAYKSIPAGLEFELPSFTVLTGENGSGKSHLFQAISTLNNGQTILNGKVLNSISYIPFAGLTPQVDQQCDVTQISQRIKAVWQELENIKKRLPQFNQLTPAHITLDKDPILQHIKNIQYKEAILDISHKSNIMPSKLTEDIISEHINISKLSTNSLFNSQFALIFKSYHVHYLDNKFKKFLETEEGVSDIQLSLDNDAFIDKYGEEPWYFVNTIFERLKLPYIVNKPKGIRKETTFQFKLTNKHSGVEINTNDLSTGEKTLMSLALAVYNSTISGLKTDFLILDEPDAPLHPSMSKLMLEIIEEEIVKKHGIPVLLSTHSPTTIACTPPTALYTMTRENKIPIQCTLQDSIELLSHGIHNLNVSIENRRQIFVESSYDVFYYESLFAIISKKISFSTQPQFLPPHKLDGSNCDAVLNITRTLRDMGNTNVYGLIDWDLKNIQEKQIVVLGMGKRYAIENYIFEPHFLGLYLIRKNFVIPSDLGFTDCSSYFEVANKIKSDTLFLQKLVESIQSKINWENKNYNLVESKLIDGTSIQISEDILRIQGHKLEDLCKNTWHKLKSVKTNNGGDSALKKDIINTVINDFPELLSIDLVDTFKEIK